MSEAEKEPEQQVEFSRMGIALEPDGKKRLALSVSVRGWREYMTTGHILMEAEEVKAHLKFWQDANDFFDRAELKEATK